MWKCKKCKEENEDSFDTCWKCQTFSELGSRRYTQYVEETKKKDEKKLEIKNRESSIEESFQKRKLEIWTITIVSFLVLNILIIFLGGLLKINTQHPLIVFIIFFISTQIKKYYSKFIKEEITKEIDKKTN
jgi:uncharacterized membrane protein YvbJ